MRLDLFLKVSRLVPRRSLAQAMCEAGAVYVNGSQAKSSHPVRTGDELRINQRGFLTTYRVLSIPTGQVSKANATSLYELVSKEANSN